MSSDTNLRSVLLFACMAILAHGAQAQHIVIDDYTSGPGAFATEPSDYSSSPFVQTGLDPNHVLNGSREIDFIGISESQGTGDVRSVVDVEDGGSFTFDTTGVSTIEDERAGIEIIVFGAGDPDWDDPASTFSVDLTEGGNDRFAINFISADIFARRDSPTARFALSLAYGTPGARVRSEVGQFELGSFSDPTTFYFPFSGAPENIDFTQVAYVRVISIDLLSGSVFEVDSLAVIPEPATGFLVLSGFGMAMRRRQRTAG